MRGWLCDAVRWIMIASFVFCHRSRGRAVAAATKVAEPPQLQFVPSAWTAALRNSRPAGKADLTFFPCLMTTASEALNDGFWCMLLRCNLQSQQAATWGRVRQHPGSSTYDEACRQYSTCCCSAAGEDADEGMAWHPEIAHQQQEQQHRAGNLEMTPSQWRPPSTAVVADPTSAQGSACRPRCPFDVVTPQKPEVLATRSFQPGRKLVTGRKRVTDRILQHWSWELPRQSAAAILKELGMN